MTSIYVCYCIKVYAETKVFRFQNSKLYVLTINNCVNFVPAYTLLYAKVDVFLRARRARLAVPEHDAQAKTEGPDAFCGGVRDSVLTQPSALRPRHDAHSRRQLC